MARMICSSSCLESVARIVGGYNIKLPLINVYVGIAYIVDQCSRLYVKSSCFISCIIILILSIDIFYFTPRKILRSVKNLAELSKLSQEELKEMLGNENNAAQLWEFFHKDQSTSTKQPAKPPSKFSRSSKRFGKSWKRYQLPVRWTVMMLCFGNCDEHWYKICLEQKYCLLTSWVSLLIKGEN